MGATATLAADYEAVTRGCGLLDRSERGKLALTGAGAREFLQGQVTNDVVALAPGSGCYAAFLTPKGKMLGDLRILACEEELLLDTERATLQELFNMIRRFSIGYDVALHKRTLERGLLSLIGPAVDALLAELAPGPEEHAHRLVELDGTSARVIRTDTGADLLAGAEDVAALHEALIARGAASVGEAAPECLRVERGRPRYGLDLDDSVIPQEAGLNDSAVSFTKGCYVGQETVARLFYRGKPNRHLRGLRLGAQAEHGMEVRHGERVVGRIGSACESPSLGAIALALLRREVGEGAQVSVGPADLPAEVVGLPFPRPPRA